ncbi:MAG: hypothetical protein ACFE0O_11015 [Opitutales bacterium]
MEQGPIRWPSAFRLIHPCLGLAVLLLMAGVPALSGRIGDNRARLEERIEADRLGFQVPDDTAEIWVRKSPLGRWLDLLGDGFTTAAYFKSANGETATLTDFRQKRLPEGWQLVVLYLNNISVLEYYQRTDGRRPRAITDAEQEGLLARHLEGARWMKVEDPEAPVLEASALDGDLVLSNGRLWARTGGRDFLIYRPELDIRFAEEALRRQAELDAEQQQAAPLSLRGF